MPQGEASIVDGTGSQTGGGNRWGDYTDTTVDPTDDCTFWHVNEYIPVTSERGWRLRIGAFRLPGCAGGGPTSTPTQTGTPAPPIATSTTTPTFTPAAVRGRWATGHLLPYAGGAQRPVVGSRQQDASTR